MKRKLLFIFFIASLSAQGQTSVYHPFPDSNAVWNINYFNYCFGFGWENRNYSITIEGDTLIGTQIYHQLTTPFIQVISGPQPCPQNYAGYKGAVRNDSTNKKVFYVPPADSTEQLLYDFNLQVGDTVKGFLDPLWLIDIVQSVDSVLVGNAYRKRWLVNTSYSIYIIEGIGSTYGLVERSPGNVTDHGDYSITCFSQNNQALYPDSVTNCNLIDGITTITDNAAFELFPNPATEEIRIENAELKIEKVELYNTVGEKVFSKQQTTHDKQQTVDVSQLLPGVYFVAVTDDKGNKITRKFIKM